MPKINLFTMKVGQDYHEALADQIRAYWKKKGYRVKTNVIRETRETVINGLKSSITYWTIKSNLVNGYPKDYYNV